MQIKNKKHITLKKMRLYLAWTQIEKNNAEIVKVQYF